AYAGAGRGRADDDRLPVGQHRARGLRTCGFAGAESDDRRPTTDHGGQIGTSSAVRFSALPGEGHLVEHLAAEALGGTCDRLAANRAVELDRGSVIRQSPYYQAVQPALPKIAAYGGEQFAAEAKTLELGTQIELVDFAIIVEAAGAIAPVIGVSRHGLAEHQDGDPAAFADGAVPPVGAAPVDELVEFRARNDALIGATPSVVMGDGDCCRIGGFRAPDFDEGRTHADNTSKHHAALQEVCLIIG